MPCFRLAMPKEPTENNQSTSPKTNTSRPSSSKSARRTPARQSAINDAEQARLNEKHALESGEESPA